MESLKRALPLLELAALIAAAVLALVFQLRLPARLPSEEDHRAAAAAVAREAQPGDVVLLFPWWTERARLFMPEGVPVVGYLGGDGDPLRDHPRIWLLAQPNLPKADLRAFEAAFVSGREPLPGGGTYGPLQLSLFRNRRYRRPLFSAVGAVEKLRVYVEAAGGERTPCPYDAGARVHRCPGASQTVGAEWHELLFKNTRCLTFHPPGGGARLVAELDDVPSGATLAIEGGITWDRGWFKNPELSPVRFGVDDARTGAPLVSLTIPRGEEGSRRAEHPLPAASGMSAATPLALRLWSRAENADLRDLCLDLRVEGPEGAP